MGVVLPDGELPAFNDSNQVDLYAQDYLYEEAYAASKNPDYLPILAKYGRTDREALLFGVPGVPRPQTLVLKSQVFAEAGYAALRNSRNDLTVIAKFGQHGGAHGHYDKLNFVLYSQGRVMGVDPGTQLYGLPLHQQWDSMTVAHNTVTVDETRQAAATGHLVDWQTGPDWVAVTMDAGAVYPDVSFRRSLLLTPNYCVVADHLHSSASHTFDWTYHDAGTLTVMQPQLTQAVDNLPSHAGYGLLKQVKATDNGAELVARFVVDGSAPPPNETNSNSPAATMRPASAQRMGHTPGSGTASLTLIMPADGSREVMSGVAPGHDLKRPVPFVLARKQGDDARFSAVLSPDPKITVREKTGDGGRVLTLAGPGFSDTVTVNATIALQHSH